MFQGRGLLHFSFLWPQCLVHTHDPSWSNWSTFRALRGIIKNKKHTLFCLMVLSWGMSLELLVAILPTGVNSQHRIKTAETQKETAL